MTDLEILNAIVQVIFDYYVFQFVGIKGIVYLFGGFFLGLGLHPLAGHYISDHYVFQDGQETFRYIHLIPSVKMN